TLAGGRSGVIQQLSSTRGRQRPSLRMILIAGSTLESMKTMRSDDIATRRLSRRSALAAIAAVTATAGRAEAKATDSDPTDPPDHGRTGFTDRDAGQGSDGAGRGVCAERGWSD